MGFRLLGTRIWNRKVCRIVAFGTASMGIRQLCCRFGQAASSPHLPWRRPKAPPHGHSQSRPWKQIELCKLQTGQKPRVREQNVYERNTSLRRAVGEFRETAWKYLSRHSKGHNGFLWFVTQRAAAIVKP